MSSSVLLVADNGDPNRPPRMALSEGMLELEARSDLVDIHGLSWVLPMNYPHGEKVLLGDTVDLGGGTRGIVVAVIDDESYAVGFSAEEWRYLGRGALLRAPGFGLLHCPDTEHDFTLIERGRSGSPAS